MMGRWLVSWGVLADIAGLSHRNRAYDSMGGAVWPMVKLVVDATARYTQLTERVSRTYFREIEEQVTY